MYDSSKFQLSIPHHLPKHYQRGGLRWWMNSEKKHIYIMPPKLDLISKWSYGIIFGGGQLKYNRIYPDKFSKVYYFNEIDKFKYDFTQEQWNDIIFNMLKRI